jgi:hypothetical protein
MEGKRRPVGVSKAAATPLCPFFLSILLTSLLLAQPPHSVQHTSHLRAAEQGALRSTERCLLWWAPVTTNDQEFEVCSNFPNVFFNCRRETQPAQMEGQMTAGEVRPNEEIRGPTWERGRCE